MTVDGGRTNSRIQDCLWHNPERGEPDPPPAVKATLVLWKEGAGRLNVELDASPRDNWIDFEEWAMKNRPGYEVLSAYMRIE